MLVDWWPGRRSGDTQRLTGRFRLAASYHGPCALSPGMGYRTRQSGQMLHVGAVREGSTLGRGRSGG